MAGSGAAAAAGSGVSGDGSAVSDGAAAPSGADGAACSGATAQAFFEEFYADRAFLGSGGVHPEAGLTDYYPAEVVVRRTIIAHTAACYVLADSSKLGAIAVHRVCPLDRVTAVLTDDAADPAACQALVEAGAELRIASTAQQQGM